MFLCNFYAFLDYDLGRKTMFLFAKEVALVIARFWPIMSMVTSYY
jgi:hypothetical protein